MTSDAEIIWTISGLTIEFVNKSAPVQDQTNYRDHFNKADSEIIRSEIETLLGKKVIELVEHEQGEFIII